MSTPTEDDNKINHQKGRHPSQSPSQPEKKVVPKCFESLKEWLIDEDKGKWIEQMRGMLSLVATVISTMTFQAGINPPGGIYPADVKNKSGQSVFAYHPDSTLKTRYDDFTIYNTISFGASLGVTILLVSGIPLKNSFPVWLLSIGMCITLAFLGLTYYNGIRLVNPHGKIDKAAPWVWSIFIACIALILTIRFLVWLLYVGLHKLKASPTTRKDTNTDTITVTKPYSLHL